MPARRQWTAKDLERMRRKYLATRGNQTAVARLFSTTRQMVALLSKRHKWAADIPAVEAKARELSNLSIAQHRAQSIDLIDNFIDHQRGLARKGKKFDAQGVQALVKTRELLSGGATERIDVLAFLAEWSKLPPDERRRRLADARAGRPAAG